MNSYAQEDNGQKGRFQFSENDVKLAEMTYTWAGNDRIIIDHTEVDNSLRGQGVGEKLVRMAVDFAREREISIIPLCPFARAIFNKYEELQDVL